jgi:nitroreductase
MKKATILFLSCTALAACLFACLGRAQSGIKTTNEMNAETITLVTPAETGVTLLAALQARASVRSYTGDGLTMEQLSGVLWAAAGENRPGLDGAPSRLTAPSAMALYPIRTYAVLPGGIYLYDAPTHTLKRVVEGDHRSLAGLQDFVYTAPLNIMYIADMSVFGDRWSSGAAKPEDAEGGMPEADILRVCALDAAGYCQNANLWAAGNGLGSVTRAGARGEEFLKTISAPDSYRFVLAQTVGIPMK